MSWLKGVVIGYKFKGEDIIVDAEDDPLMITLLNNIWYSVTGPRFERAAVDCVDGFNFHANIDHVRWYPT
jgi:hypothetical protein